MSTTTTAPAVQTVDRASLARLRRAARVPAGVINMIQNPGRVTWREPGIWIDADSTRQLIAAVAVLTEALGDGGAADIAHRLNVTRHGGGYGAEPSYSAHLPGWAIGAYLR